MTSNRQTDKYYDTTAAYVYIVVSIPVQRSYGIHQQKKTPSQQKFCDEVNT